MVRLTGKMRATQHDVLGSYGPLIKNSKIFLNSGVTPPEGNELISSGKVDGIFIGFMWIAHPDLAKRVEHGKPLDNPPVVSLFQGHGGSVEEQRAGYTDYSEATY
jgi:2,4-dienoyl-CoA reductase-like NADH-dependent reductase (Old Yellow Enzyme family)